MGWAPVSQGTPEGWPACTPYLMGGSATLVHLRCGAGESGEADAEVGDRLSRRHSGAVRDQLEMADPGGLVKPGIRTVDRLPANTMGFLAHGDATVVKVEVEIVVRVPPVRTDAVVARATGHAGGCFKRRCA